MQCEYFGLCGSCNLGGLTYKEQLNKKVEIEKDRFKSLHNNSIDIIQSSDGSFRNRSEFRIWKTYDEDDNFKLNYAMNDVEKKILPIESCSIVSQSISNLMPKLLKSLSINKDLNF